MTCRLVTLILACLWAMPASAEMDARGPILGAASNFGQNWQPQALDGGQALGITAFRDEVIWNHVQQPDGRLVFGSMREAYPEMLAARGMSLVLLGYSGHPNWDEGRAPRSPEAQAAFADYHARIVRRFPLIRSVEVGNEYNSHEFAAQEGWPEDLAARAALYVELLEATRRALHEVDPAIRILGGAAHSVPLAWIEAVAEAGGATQMDAVVLHPYTSAPEQLARQIAAMRRIEGLARMPVEVTEFGTTEAAIAPGYLLRMYCQMAISGVTRAVWYPFSPRGDGLVPLVEEDGAPTPVGLAYATIRRHLEGRRVVDVAPDDFTYACRFGERALVIWGAPRELRLAPGLRALSATGAELLAPPALSRKAPLLILSEDAPIDLGRNVTLAAQRVRADSFDQFGTGLDPDAPGFSVFVRHRDGAEPLEPRPGQERPGVPWTPYLGFSLDGELRVGPGWASPSSWGAENPLEVVYAYRPEGPETVDLLVEIAPDPGSVDGLTLALMRNDVELERLVLGEARQLRATGVELTAGDRLEAVLGPNRDATGDHARIRVRVEARP